MISFHDVPLTCINQSAIHYQVPAALIMAIIKVEGGRIGTISENKNGTDDLGIMQINTSWTKTFEKRGYTTNEVIYNSCKNIEVGTWILGQCLANNKDMIKAIGDYHSHTPYYNEQYAHKVLVEYNFIMKTLDKALSPECKKDGLIC